MRKLLVAALVVLVGAGVTIAVTVDSSGKPTVTITTANGKKVEAPVEAVASAGGVGAERGDGNAGTQRSSDRANPDGPVVSGPPPAAAPFQRGCLTRSNTRNFSYRNGTRPSLVVAHLTVSANRAGWSDVNGVAVFLNAGSTQASANYIIDAENHCAYTVAETLKAWAQANFNSATACSIEQINTGNESRYGATRLRQLARVVSDCARRWHIPLRRAKVSGCSVVRAGVIDHYHLGSCGGGHFGVHNFGTGCRNRGPSANTWRCVDFIVNRAKAARR
jgi:hypothetical protein